MRGGYLLPGFIDAHVHFPQVRILGGLGCQLLDWLERIAGSPVFDSSHDPVVAMTRRDTGAEIFNEVATAIGPSHDYALIELMHAQVGWQGGGWGEGLGWAHGWTISEDSGRSAGHRRPGRAATGWPAA